MLSWSPVGLTFREGLALTSHFTMLDSEIREHDETYTLVIGETKEARDHYRELPVHLRESLPPRRYFNLLFPRVDDGAAFRFALPEQEALTAFEIVKENTEFHFPVNMKAWAFQINTFTYRSKEIPAHNPHGHSPRYRAGLYSAHRMQRKDGVTLSITEADRPTTRECTCAASREGPPGRAGSSSKTTGVAVRGKTPFSSPWRVLMVGDAPGRLIESTIILNLNAPCAFDDVSWIKPGKAIFPWWPAFYCDRPGVPNALGFENQKFYIDFASENKFSYLELEPPWYGPEDDCIEHPEKYDITKPVPDLRLPELIEYGKNAGVRLFIWAHWQNVDRAGRYGIPALQVMGRCRGEDRLHES